VLPRGEPACGLEPVALGPAHPGGAERNRLHAVDRHDPRCRTRPLRQNSVRRGADAEARLMGAARGCVPGVHAARENRPDEIDTVVAAEAVAGALRSLGYATEIVALAPDLGALDDLPTRRPLAVFNLVDAVDGDGRLAPMVPARLDALGLRYTG